MVAGDGRATGVVIKCVSVPIVIKIVLIGSAVNLACAALGHHLHLGACGTIEVRRLVRRSNPEFLNTIHRSRHDARSRGCSRAPPRPLVRRRDLLEA